MMAKFLWLVRGRLWLILPVMAFALAMAVTSFLPDKHVAAWTEERPPQDSLSSKGQAANLVFSPDGRTILSVAGSRSQLIEASTGRVMFELGKGRVHFPTFFHGGRLLAGQLAGTSRSLDTVKVWEVATGRELASFAPSPWQEPGQSFTTSSDGPALAFAEGTDPIEVDYRVWNADSGLNARKFPGHFGLADVLSPDGRSLITGVQDAAYTLTEWDVATGRSLGTIEHPPSYPTALLFAPDGRLLVGSLVTDQTCLVDRKTGRSQPIPMAIWPGQRPSIGKDGRLLVGSTHINSLDGFEAFDLTVTPPRAMAYRLIHGAPIQGSRVTTLALVEGKDRAEVKSFSEVGVIQVSLSPDGHRVAAQMKRQERTSVGMIFGSAPPQWVTSILGPASHKTHQVKVFEVESGRLLATVPITEHVVGPGVLTFSPHGDRLVVETALASGILRLNPSADFPWSVQVWHVPSRRPWGLALGLASVSGLLAMAVGRWLDVRSRRQWAARELA